jgi:RiboL-PSP-HEPN
MSSARTLFLSRITSLIKSLGIDAVAARPLTDQAHNDVARMLRNGLAVVGFAALEDFVKSRTSEVLSEVGRTSVPFRDLPEKLRYATTFEAIDALSYQMSLRPRSDRVSYIQEHAQKIASTSSAAYELTPQALGFDQANLQDETIKSILKCFLIENPWGEMTRLASRLGLAALPLDETYRSAATRRHRAAHVANADIPQADLVQFTKEALAIAIGFDALLTRSLAMIQAHDRRFLQGTIKVSASSIVIRSITHSDAKWRERVEGRAPAVKVEATSDAIVAVARPRAIAAKNLLVIHSSNSDLVQWECY